jgi:hypothetical protein
MTEQPAHPLSLSFPRIADIPFDVYLAALDSWNLSGHGELRLGDSLLRGPIEHDQSLGIWQIEVRMARGPLCPRVRMRLYIERRSRTATALELAPCQRVTPSAAYFAAGRRLMNSLTRPLPVRVPAKHDEVVAKAGPGPVSHSNALACGSRSRH